MKTLATALALAALLSPSLARAGEARTVDGPDGSEIGHGGYDPPQSSHLALGVAWGAALGDTAPLAGPPGMPLFVAPTLSYSANDLFSFDATAAWLALNGNVDLLVGPRIKSAFYPVSVSASLQAGAMILPAFGLRFGLSPEVRADVRIGSSMICGLGYAIDVPLGGGTITHRVFMHLGLRF